VRARGFAPVAPGATPRQVEPGNTRGGAVVGGRGARAPLRVRAGDDRLLPVAGARGGAHHGVEKLATPRRDVARRSGADWRLADPGAEPLDLVGTDDRGPGAHPLPRPGSRPGRRDERWGRRGGAVPGRPRGAVHGVSTILPTFCRRRIRRWAAAASVKG